MATVCFCELSFAKLAASSMFAGSAGTTRAGDLMVKIRAERTIAASPERVFDWLLDPANLTVSPLFRKAAWAKDSSGPGVGALREVTGIGFWAHEQITAYDAPRSYSYLAVRSFPGLAT
jgi:Polyketide cyclase / dehydrase and lipid transport